MCCQLSLKWSSAGTYAVIVAIDAPNAVLTVAVPCSACVGGLSAGAEVRPQTSSANIRGHSEYC